MPDIRGWNFEAGTSKGSAKIFGTSKEWDWNFEVWIWNFERTKFQFLISGRWLYPRENFECSNFLRGTFFWNFECLKIQWKLSHSKFQNLQNFERKFWNFEVWIWNKVVPNRAPQAVPKFKDYQLGQSCPSCPSSAQLAQLPKFLPNLPKFSHPAQVQLNLTKFRQFSTSSARFFVDIARLFWCTSAEPQIVQVRQNVQVQVRPSQVKKKTRLRREIFLWM